MSCPNAAAIRYARTKPTWRMTRIELAKVWAEHTGIHSHRNGGGWLYFPRSDRPYVQGWERLADQLEASGLLVVGRGLNWSKGVSR